MRLHSLEVQAFGPFAGTASVDFDALAESGLFLLSGATGAGKTSVLDAVCFALYGDVPGDRSTAKRLRSDQADPSAPPRVVLEATLGGRRFRIVRSPAWERAKKRGSGTTTEPAKVTISERVGGSWQPLSSRLDETGDLVGRLLGLDLTQFTQVAMLPQGRFQAFLRARSDERHKLLQQLFRTGRFEAVERWLREHRIALGRTDAAHHQGVADVVSRASEASGTARPAHIDVRDLTPCVDDDTLRAWVHQLLVDATEARTAAVDRAATLGTDEATARGVLEQARIDVQRRQALVDARRERDELTAAASTHDVDRRRLDAGRRAAAVLPWERQAAQTASTSREAREAADLALHAVTTHLGRRPERSELGDVAEVALAAAAAALALEPRVERCSTLEERRRRAEQRLGQLDADLTRLDGDLVARSSGLSALHAEVDSARQVAQRVEGATTSAQLTRSRLDAHRQAAALGPRLHEARETWLSTREQTLVLKDELVTLQMARVEGMAAELAGALAVGGCCPVCGSAEHPSRARPAPGAPDAATERTARAALDDAAVVEHAHDQQVRELERSLAAAQARAGDGDHEQLAAVLAAQQEALSDALQAQGRLPELEERLTAERAAIESLESHVAARRTEAAATQTELASLSHELDALQSEIADALDGHADPHALHTAHSRTAALCRAAVRAEDDAATSAETAAESAVAARSAASGAGFADLGDARSAALDPSALARLNDVVRRHEHRLAAVTEVLRGAADDDATPLPDLAALDTLHADALALLRDADATAGLESVRVERLTGLVAELDAALTAWAPLRRDLDVVTRLSAFVEGKSSDNALRMRLSAYVLAYRLGQVVASANERLATMSDQRYSLEHTGRRGAGETRGGLSLLVRDDWSGESRDPATLSGGETFVVSLALALGLADVIAHEAGGAALDTLFVDEGFGSLDADTLDDVMDTLDSLRDGGRVVGVVSHVAEMRDRIPTQLHVTKSRNGSTLCVRR